MIGKILQKVLNKKNIPHTITDPWLLDIWEKAVGTQIAVQTLPVTLRRGTLNVRVSAPVWMHQLQFLKEEILIKLNEQSGRNDFLRLRFSIGEIPAPPSDVHDSMPPAATIAPLRKRDRDMMRECLSSIRDSELKEIVERVMSSEIRRRRKRENSTGL